MLCIHMAEESQTPSAPSSVPKLTGDRDVLTMEERERSLDEAIQWVREEINSLKSQDQSLMRKFLALRTQINNLKDELPTSIDRSSSVIGYPSPKLDDEDVFFDSDPRKRFYSDTSFRAKSYSSGSEDEKF